MNGDLFAASVEEAAVTIDGGPTQSFKEERVEIALRDALARRVGRELVFARRKVAIPDWDANVGGIDVLVRHGSVDALRYVAELKVDDVGDILWDLFKMVAATQVPSVEAAYLVVAASEKKWASTADCVGLFPATPEAPRSRVSRDLFHDYQRAWTHLLNTSTPRFTRVPGQIETRFVANHPVAAYPGYELRAIAVRPLINSGWLDIARGWPVSGPTP